MEGHFMDIDYHDFTDKSTSRKKREKLCVGDYYTNSVKCLKCGVVIRSKNVHDAVTCKCGNVTVDGGSHYLKRGYKEENSYLELSEKFDDILDEKID